MRSVSKPFACGVAAWAFACKVVAAGYPPCEGVVWPGSGKAVAALLTTAFMGSAPSVGRSSVSGSGATAPAATGPRTAGVPGYAAERLVRRASGVLEPRTTAPLPGRGTGLDGWPGRERAQADLLNPAPPARPSSEEPAATAIARMGLSPQTLSASEGVEAALSSRSVEPQGWRGIVSALHTLPRHRQARVLSASGLDGGVSAALSTAELFQRLERAKTLTRMFALQQALAPATARMLLGANLDLASDERLRLLAVEPRVQALGTRLEAAKRIGVGLRRSGKDDDVQMVGGGEPVCAGGLSGVPPGISVRLVRGGGGELCLRPTRPDDYRLDPVRKAIGRHWDPTAFPDMGMLLMRPVGAGLEKVKVCSFIRVSRGFALTAAHCMAEEVAEQVWRKRSFDHQTHEALALIPDLSTAEKRPGECFDRPLACGYHVSRVTGEARFPEGLDLLGVVPKPDIAVFELSLPAAAHAPSTWVSRDETAAQDITLVGYGLTNIGGAVYQGELQVGWQMRPPRLDQAVLVWATDPADGFAGPCMGDSGGAVFEGSISGPNDPRRLAAVISFGSGGEGYKGVERCMRMSTGTATRIGSHLDWICSTSGGSALGCGS